jgi:hypothetical protein
MEQLSSAQFTVMLRTKNKLSYRRYVTPYTGDPSLAGSFYGYANESNSCDVLCVRSANSQRLPPSFPILPLCTEVLIWEMQELSRAIYDTPHYYFQPVRICTLIRD